MLSCQCEITMFLLFSPCPADLVPREVGERWLKYFREELPTVAFKCSTQQQDRGLGHKRMPGGQQQPDKGGKGAEDALQVGAGTGRKGWVC